MKRKYFILFILIILCCASCAQIGNVFKDLKAPSPEETLFETAEKNFRNENFQEALVLYREYLSEYPDSGLAPAALMKIGKIYSEEKHYEQARNVYAELIEKYPGTDFNQRARVEILYTYYQEGSFRWAIAYSEGIEAERLPRDIRLRIDLIVGDSHMAMESYREALLHFLKAFDMAEKAQRRLVGKRLIAALSFQEPADIRKMLERLNGEPPSAYFMYQLGTNLMAQGRIGEAHSVLSRFIETYPRHELIEFAEKRIESLRTASFFEGHRIGCLLPLSGKYEAFGRQALRAIEFALSESGKRNVADPPFELIVRDTAGDPDLASQAVYELSEQRVAAIIGPMVTATTAAEVAQKLGIPMITMTQKPGDVDIGDYIFCNFLTPQMQVEILVKYTMGTLGLKRFAVLYPDEVYGRTFLNLFWDALIENGGEIVGLESYNPAHTDFSESIKKLVGLYYELPEDLKRAEITSEDIEALVEAERMPYNLFNDDAIIGGQPGQVRRTGEMVGRAPFELEESVETEDAEPEPIVDFDAIFIPDSPRKAGLIIPQLRYYDIKDVYLLGTNLWHSQELIDIARYQIRKAVIPEGFFANSQDPGVKRFVDEYTAVFGHSPEFIEAVSYDTANILFDLIARPEINDRQTLKEALLDMPAFEGVTGITKFARNGEAEKEIYLLDIKRGRFEEIRR